VQHNGAGVPLDGLDYAVHAKLYHMLNEDFDKVVDLCMEQAVIWREQRAARVTDRKAMERELVRLEAAISRLTDAIEQGQPGRHPPERAPARANRVAVEAGRARGDANPAAS